MNRSRILLAIVYLTISCGIRAESGANNLSDVNNNNNPSIGFLVVATGKYIRYIDALFKSAQQFFLPGHRRKFIVFTDHLDEAPQGPDIISVYQKRLGWPYDTMMRCWMYLQHKDLYEGLDYLYACDADTICVDTVGEEILGDLVATRHPCFLSGRRGEFETNQNSLAYVSDNEGGQYFAGGFYGGKTADFLAMNQAMYERIQVDLEHGIVPRWHDESHLNRYFIDHKPTLILSSEYCWTGPWCNHLHARMAIAGKELVRN